MRRKINVNQFLFLIAYLLGMIASMPRNLATLSDSHLVSVLSWGLCAVAAVFVLIKLFLDSRYRVSALIYMFLVGILLLLTFYRSRYNHLIFLMIVVLGVRHVCIHDIVKTDLIVRLIIIALVVISSRVGLIENRIVYRAGEYARHSMGFYHPNTLPSMVLVCVLEEAWLHKRRFSLPYAAFIVALGAGIYAITLNRTSILLLVSFPLIMWLFMGKSKQHVSNRLRICGQLMFPAVVLFCYVAMRRSGDAGFFKVIDQLMSQRFTNCRTLFDHYSVALLGQRVDLSVSDLNRFFGIYVAILDVAYLRMLLQAGPIVLFLMGWMHICAVGEAYRNQDRYTLMIICVYAALGVSESMYNNAFMNFSLLFGAQGVLNWLEQNGQPSFLKRIPRQ